MSDKALALTVVGVAGFQLLEAYNRNAPSLPECRAARAGDPTVGRQLLDADILVGTTAIVLGSAIAYMSKDKTALLVMLAVYGTTTLWHHTCLNGDSV